MLLLSLNPFAVVEKANLTPGGLIFGGVWGGGGGGGAAGGNC